MPALLRARLYVNFTSGYDNAFRELLAKGFGTSHPAGKVVQPGQAKVSKSTHTLEPSGRLKARNAVLSK